MKNAEQLKAIYADEPFEKQKSRVARFDIGGSYYDAVNAVQAGSGEPQYITQAPTYSPAPGTSTLTPQVSNDVNSAVNAPIAPSPSVSTNLLTNAQLGQAGNPNATAGAPSGGSGLGGLASSIGNSNLLPAIVGILTAAGHFAQSKGAATLPAMPGTPGFTGSGALPALPGANGSNGFGPAGGYNFGNYSGAPTPGLGYAPRTQAPAMPTSSYYTYGQGPEHQFFTLVNPTTGVAPPNSSGATPPPGQKKGGRIKKYAIGGMMQQNPMLGAAQPVAAPATGIGAPASAGVIGGALSGAPQPMARPAPQPTLPTARPLPRPAPQPTMPVARPGMAPGMANTQPIISPRPMMRAAGGSSDSTGYANTWGQWTPPAAGSTAQSTVTGTPARGALSDAIPRRTMVGHAQGGAMPQGSGSPTVSRHVRGPGDGTSDSIPARLANGEYVLSADVVSGLGNGDNGSGAKRLDAFVHNVRVHKSQNASQGKLPEDAKPIHQYMGQQ
jgi:hypothetical protein